MAALEAKGLRAVMLFGVTGADEKDAVGSVSKRRRRRKREWGKGARREVGQMPA